MTMTWEEFWLPHLTTWILGAVIGAVISTIVSLFVRRWLKPLIEQQRIASEDALTASQAAADQASQTGGQVEEMKQRMDGLLTALLRQESLALKVRDLENQQGAVLAFMADLEHERHITGNLAAFQRAHQEQT